MKIAFAALFGLLTFFSSIATAQNTTAPRDKINMGKTQQSAQTQSLNFGSKAFSLSTPEIRCYSIRRITLVDEAADGTQSSSQFYWALDRAKSALQLSLPHCLGEQGLNLLTKRVQTEISSGASVSVRVVRPEQDLHSGSLVLNVLLSDKQTNKKGHQITATSGNSKKVVAYTDGFKASASNKNPQATAQYEAALKKVKENGGAIVVTANRNTDKEGVKTVRQSIVNANKTGNAPKQPEVSVIKSVAVDRKNTPSVKVVSGDEPNNGKLAAKGQIGVSGAGSASEGRWQADAQLVISNILAYNDKFKATFAHSTKPKATSKANRNAAVEYEIPFGNWSASTAYKDESYYREVFFGKNSSALHSGKSKSANLTITYKLYEDEQRKTSVSGTAWTRQSKTDYIGVQNEKYRLFGWAAVIAHQEKFGNNVLSAKVAYKQATSYKNNHNAEMIRPRIVSAELGLRTPFTIMDESFYFDSAWKAQWAKKTVHIDDHFMLGGMDTIRGFSGNQMIAGTKGWFGRNELGWHIQDNHYILYTAVDFGKVSRDLDQDEKATLAGSVIGLKGSRKSFNYDFFVAKPLSKPKGFKVPKYLIGANVSYRF